MHVGRQLAVLYEDVIIKLPISIDTLCVVCYTINDVEVGEWGTQLPMFMKNNIPRVN